MKFALLSLITLLFASCNTPSKVKIQRVPYNPEEFAKYQKEGTATITGQAFMKTQSGDVKYAAGNEVWLNPKTSMSDQWYNEAYLGNDNHFNPEQELVGKGVDYKKYLEAFTYTQADGEGRFKFEKVPAGKYYLVSKVVWKVPSQYGLHRTGGYIAREVTIKEGESHNFILTR